MITLMKNMAGMIMTNTIMMNSHAESMNDKTAGTNTLSGVKKDLLSQQIATLMWLSSPALPVGGFSFSEGLEQAIERKVVKDGDSLRQCLEDAVRYGLMRWDLPLLKLLYRASCKEDRSEFERLDARLLSGRGTKELCEEDRATGSALIRLLKALDKFPSWADGLHPGYISALAICGAQTLPVCQESCQGLMLSFLMSWAQNQVSAAIKAVPLGQNRGQQVLVSLIQFFEDSVLQVMDRQDPPVGVSLPAHAILSSLHEVQYSRLFRS